MLHRRLQPTQLRRLGQWQIVHTAGSGRFSQVYFCRPHDATDGPCDYAIKELRPEFAKDREALTRFRQEAVIGISVSHPNLITVLSTHFEDQPNYIVMPRLRGSTVRALLQSKGTVDVAQALWITRQAAAALSSLHRAGWVHADVKPENLFIAPDGHVTLIDLGLAVELEGGVSPDESIRGTLAYTAPEAFTSSRGLCPASDTYSLGATLYQMLAGHPPFESALPARLVESHLHTLPPSLRSQGSRIPKEIAQLVNQMLSKNPQRRPSCTDELPERLARLEVDHFCLRNLAV